jgi:hypothetical protein
VHFCLLPYTSFTLLLPLHIIYFLHRLSTKHKCTKPCHFPLLLRKRGWTRILRRGVLGRALPRLPFLWSYGVFRCSVSLRVIVVLRNNIYIIMILYLWHLIICEHFWSVCVKKLILDHTYDEYLILLTKLGMTLPICRSTILVQASKSSGLHFISCATKPMGGWIWRGACIEI